MKTRDARAYWALGAMSGTSLDGVDAALLRTDGVDILEFGTSGYRGYTGDERAVLRRALGKTADDAATEVVEAAHAELLSTLDGAEVVGFHGQTVHHDPGEGVTVQLGDGGVLAECLGLPVVWDFRSSDVAMGGQGAPLAPFFHFACARWIGAMRPLAFLNLGGVGNLTYVDPRKERPEDAGALLAFDTGPANAPIDDLVARAGRGSYDADGRMAAAGRADDAMLDRFLGHPYFRKVPPKSLDRNDFRGLLRSVEALSAEDGAATLTAAAATAVTLGMEFLPEPPDRVLVTGGGRHNPVMMRMLAAGLGCPVLPVEEVGLDGDMLEAQAFAYLAVRVMNGLPTSAPGTTGVAAPVGGGQVSRPRAVNRRA